MARPIKQGLDYFPKDVDFYDDDKIMDLLEEYGPLGLTVYEVVISLVYKNGYYLEVPVDKLAARIVRIIGNKWIKNKSLVQQVIDYCADIDLLCKDLLRQNVITSAGVQRRYSEVTARNKVNKTMYWLLEKNDPNAACETMPEKIVSVTETPVNVTETAVNAPEMQQSKVNKIKLNESKVNALPQKGGSSGTDDDTNTYGKNVHLTKDDYDALAKDYGEEQLNEYIQKVDRYIDDHGLKPYGNHCETIRSWLEKDGKVKISDKPSNYEHSYDLDKLLNYAMTHVPTIP